MPDPRKYVPDLLANDRVQQVSRHYLLCVVLGCLAPALAGALLNESWWRGGLVGLLFGGLVRLVAVQHSMFLVNSVCHLFGGRAYPTRDGSRNNLLVVPLTLGPP